MTEARPTNPEPYDHFDCQALYVPVPPRLLDHGARDPPSVTVNVTVAAAGGASDS